MKFTLENTKKGLRIRREILDASGFAGEDALHVCGEDDAVVVLKQDMTAMELVQAIQSLKDLTADLLVSLAGICGLCQHSQARCTFAGGGAVPQEFGLRDVSPEMRELLRETGVCLGTLDSLLAENEVIYHG